jgi:hypothetical protein
VGWKREPIIGSAPSGDYPRRLDYLVQWDRYSHDENMWEMYDNALKWSYDLLTE